MIDTVYVEASVADHPRTAAILAALPKARTVACSHYGEIFNRGNQHFRLQKARPALLLAEKRGRLVLPAPPGFAIGHADNYYFSHMYNCLYDCRYCFLQGMYRSAHYLLFVNYEDFAAGIIDNNGQPGSCYFSGYDCDSLALDPVTRFSSFILDAFSGLPGTDLELRTKSTQVRALLERDALPNVIVAFSLLPAPLAEALDHRAPAIARRLAAAARLQQAGWRIGLRFDPVIDCADFERVYGDFFRQVFRALDAARIDSVTLGGFRLPKGFFKRMRRLYPREALFATALEEDEGNISYGARRSGERLGWCRNELERFVAGARIFTQGVSP